MAPTLSLAKSLWGVAEAEDPGAWDGLFSRIKAEGFEAVEAITLTWRKDASRFTQLLEKHGLQLICQIHTAGGDLDPVTGGYTYCGSNKLHDHLASFVKLASEAKALGAVLINSHSGHDSWGSGEKAVSFFKHALKVERALGVPIVHETHRRAEPHASPIPCPPGGALPVGRGRPLLHEAPNGCTCSLKSPLAAPAPQAATPVLTLLDGGAALKSRPCGTEDQCGSVSLVLCLRTRLRSERPTG